MVLEAKFNFYFLSTELFLSLDVKQCRGLCGCVQTPPMIISPLELGHYICAKGHNIPNVHYCQRMLSNHCSQLDSMFGFFFMTPCLCKDIRYHIRAHFSKVGNHQIRHHAAHKAGCQPGDCIWSDSMVK